MHLPSDLKILNKIYNIYYKEFSAFSVESQHREIKIYVPIDCSLIAKKMNVDADIIFGRLYYYLNEKYSYTKDDGSKVHFFALKIKNDKKCINFPLLSSVLSGIREENRKFTLSIVISFIALSISVITTVYTLL